MTALHKCWKEATSYFQNTEIQKGTPCLAQTHSGRTKDVVCEVN